MTTVVGDPEHFVDEALAGLCAVHADLVRRVDGGVVRAHPLAEGHVAVVIGGGSGHYPAFAGLVGEGLAAGAVCGNIFASPSARQAVDVISEVEAGAGVLLSYGNYAGDVLHFGEAVQRLSTMGIEVRTVLVTDDIASAPASQAGQRRGIAGDLVVFKIAGAAAERGADLDSVERLAQAANARTRTLGIAFGGCTLPGASEPLFRVAEGMMSIGLGIHGEPAITDVPLADVDGIADALIGPLLDERPDGADDRVVPLLNSLGSIGDEELFVLYNAVARRLEAHGVRIMEPECGRLVTSLDMSGVSLTLFWPDDELAGLWTDAAHTPAYRKPGALRGAVGGRGSRSSRPRVHSAQSPSGPLADASPSSIMRATVVVEVLTTIRDELMAAEDELGRLDQVAGDGDHGIGMTRGSTAAVEAATAATTSGASAALQAAAEAWSDRAGGTSGALWGAILRSLAPLVEHGSLSTMLDDAARAAVSAVSDLGGAVVGDKTMLDSMVPWRDAILASTGGSAAATLHTAADAAASAAASTSALTPQRGRARPLAERSLGHADPGAQSFALIAAALARLASSTEGHPSS
ncbi:MAG: dihydroxyacetone kinase family protein [Microcella sp.]|uniref:dihydroxyacetone kinase family protein n=1 Tax=Microcella sp. TaxID=1913979 RepID=UPI0024CA8749|nr:dihydroxyacetone kinase family protein [Microcella sp.]UYN83448.1 MAG: dihydroxyacetone kinase family protein [Microcella sp.]